MAELNILDSWCLVLHFSQLEDCRANTGSFCDPMVFGRQGKVAEHPACRNQDAQGYRKIMENHGKFWLKLMVQFQRQRIRLASGGLLEPIRTHQWPRLSTHRFLPHVQRFPEDSVQLILDLLLVCSLCCQGFGVLVLPLLGHMAIGHSLEVTCCSSRLHCSPIVNNWNRSGLLAMKNWLDLVTNSLATQMLVSSGSW